MSDWPSSTAATKCVLENCAEGAVLSGDLGIRDSERIHDCLTEMLATEGRLRIDVGSVTGVDTSVVQLLVAARRTATRQGREFEIMGFAKSPLPKFMNEIGLPTSELDGGEVSVPEGNSDDGTEEGTMTSGSNDEGPQLFWLTDDQMAALRPSLPTKGGKSRADDCRVLSGIVFVKRNGLRWQDAPEAYGPYKTLYTRWKRWKEMGVFTRIIQDLTSEKDGQAPARIDTSLLQALQ